MRVTLDIRDDIIRRVLRGDAMSGHAGEELLDALRNAVPLSGMTGRCKVLDIAGRSILPQVTHREATNTGAIR